LARPQHAAEIAVVLIGKPLLRVYLALRSACYLARRLLVCEPLFKAYCKTYGRGVRTGVFVHWVQGRGDIIVGDDVLIDGKCSFLFAARFSDRPTLIVGDRTEISHNCMFTVGKRITIGRHCHIASDIWMFDASGHPADPAARLAGLPPRAEEVRPIVIGDNVWIGRRSIIFPGVNIGAGSVVSTGSVVTSSIPPNTMVAGNPARKVAALKERDSEPALAALEARSQ
jgi:acetyltransferase-like isoleucine patch superfamily enzyme